MEEKKLKVVLYKSGDGYITPRVPIPMKWFEKMKLSENELEVKARFNEETGELIYVKDDGKN